MRKWTFFAGSGLLAIFAFINLVILVGCNRMAPIQPIQPDVIKACPSFLEQSLYLFVVAAGCLFLAFSLTNRQDQNHS